MSDSWPERLVGPRIIELGKSTLPAGLADDQGAFPFYCSSPQVRRIDRAIARTPAILMGTGGIATVHLAQGAFSYSTDTWAFTVSDPRTDLAFLYRQLEHQLPHIDYVGFGGSGLRHLNKKHILSLSLPVPRPEEQALIAHMLCVADMSIQENEAIVTKLKAVKQGLLHDLLTRGIDENGELRPPQSEAPQLYKFSPIGWIVAEWRFGNLSEWLAAPPKNGYSPQEAGRWTGIQMLGLGCLTREGFLPTQLKAAPQRDSRLQSAMLDDGDLLMSRANTRDLVGLVGVYRNVGTPCTYPDLMMRLRPTAETTGEFLQFVLRSPGSRRQIEANAVGTSGSMVKISSLIVRNLVVALPDKAEQDRILTCMAASDSRLAAEAENLQALRACKVGLTNDLLTGRVRVTPLLEPTAA